MAKTGLNKIGSESFGSRLPDEAFSILIAISVFVQGSYFSGEYISAFLFFCIIAFFLIKRNSTAGSFNKAAIAALLTLGGIYIISSFAAARDKYTGVLETIKILGFILVYISANYLKSTEAFFKGIFYGCAVTSVFGLLTYTGLLSFPASVLNDGKNIRLQSVIGYANGTAVYMGIGFLLTYYFITAGKFTSADKPISLRKPAPSGKSGSSAPRIANRISARYYMAAHLLLTALMLTLSRGGILLFILTAVIWLVLVRKYKVFSYVMLNFLISSVTAGLVYILAAKGIGGIGVIILAGSLAATAAGFKFIDDHRERSGKIHIGSYSVNRLSLLLALINTAVLALGALLNLQVISRIVKLSGGDGTLIERFIYIQDALRAICRHPLLGIGPGNWATEQYYYQTAQYYSKYLHNWLFQFATDAGLIAALLFILLLYVFFKRVIVRLVSERAASGHTTAANVNGFFYATILSAAVFILLHGLADTDLSFPSMLWILGGILSTGSCIREERKDSGRHRDLRVASGNTVQYGRLRRIVQQPVLLLLFIPFLLLLLIGQILVNNAQNAESAGNLELEKSIYEICSYISPFDSRVYFGLAECSLAAGEPPDQTKKYLRQAYLLNESDPAVLTLAVEYGNKLKDFELAYASALKLIAVQPLNNSGYESAMEAAEGLYKAGKISREDFEKDSQSIHALVEKANQKINPLSKYLRHQSKLQVD